MHPVHNAGATRIDPLATKVAVHIDQRNGLCDRFPIAAAFSDFVVED